MKEIIYKIKHKEEDCKGCVYSGLCVKDLCEVEHETQVPENFTELKELCKGKFAEISEHSIMIFGMLDFFDDGTLTFHNYCEIANDLTPQQMYQIIKSLIGEE